MAPKLLLLLPALFFSLVLLMVPYYCIVDPTSTTLAISQATGTVCGIMAGSQNRSIQCTTLQDLAELNASFPINSTLSFFSISGGHNFICSLRSGGASFFCWDGIRQRINRVYSGPTALSILSVGARHVAAIDRNRTKIRWWRYGCNRHDPRCHQFPKSVDGEYHSLTSGDVFTCAISGAHSVHCWGPRAKSIQRRFAGEQMRSLTAGGGRMCGLNMTGHLICTGNQSNVPSGGSFEFTSLAIGGSQTCAIRRRNGTVVCWGQHGSYLPMGSTGFEFLVAGGNLTCGLTTDAFNIACWGLNGRNWSAVTLSMPKILPGVCVADETVCSCGVYPDSGDLCGGSGVICMDSCPFSTTIEMLHAPSKTIWEMLGKWWFVYAIFGIVFAIVGISINVCMKMKWCEVREISGSIPIGPTFPVMDNVQVFSFNELMTATNNFFWGFQIGAGGFGRVYRGRLSDGRLVAVKRCITTGSNLETGFKAEVETQAKARHVNVVSLLGYCTENNARLCVFEFMQNKDLLRYIHPRTWFKRSPLFSSWKMRTKVLLDAARGIEYLHRYCEPPIIHRDIKSSNILLDENWVAKISDFGLAVFGPKPGHDRVNVATMTGTTGYMDPDFNVDVPFVTQQSDVYSFGVVILEVVTGQKAYNSSDDTQLATFAAQRIATGRLTEVLDKRLDLPVGREREAIEMVAQLAQQCVASGLQRPKINAVVTELENAVARFDQPEAIDN
ncbi:putative serine/threonine-protein kinase-like protein CCR3 [Carex littledalei]|uniref:Putative serine/threonine-protein kinase-like protein CCR3 n=1 Tax=Carex littledalei TaxID=544730 RepID=A0A833VEH9_9POAL|nr:putative serine/threonine-protein kinase-like protein CCR3 [Carex littledalei]